MTDYLNPHRIYPDDISRRIDIPPGFDSVRQVSANLSEKPAQNSPKCGAGYRQQPDESSTVCRKNCTQNATKVVTLTTLNEPDRVDFAK